MVDPIVELVRNEVNGKRVYQKLKLSGLPKHGSLREEMFYKMAARRAKIFDDMSVTMEGILNKHQSNKQRRRELQTWAGELMRQGRSRIWGMGWSDTAIGQAKMEFGRTIIDAFKKLPKA